MTHYNLKTPQDHDTFYDEEALPFIPPKSSHKSYSSSATAHPAISKKLVKFSSSLDYVDESTIFRVFDPEEPVYVGNGTEVDGN
ncbi:hypothetical protein HYALB_00010053 [Hymenoscyphus albidus]|uniref:Uncharacterized protein n=1 Tax=Hymenoscyphus albidus TaxID=595503 RepID=A0A9N9PTC7_9HELO|nr:hypothetical protein HYALB_00010053 [Hymenoscyphus albidus]